jgi:DNA-directed RNA polymerase subunit M/transcription elongation factor TFIIS
MEFCEFCDNMMYIKTNSEDAYDVHYVCKNCEHTKPMSNTSTTKVIQTFYDTESTFVYGISDNIEFDPTIPHIHDITCPNEKCTKTKSQISDVMFIKTDDIKLKFAYYCVHCKKIWENRF